MKIRSLAFASLFVLSVASVRANTITENFSADPLQNGWQVFGNTNLFHWTNQSLAVTWDSTSPNSYFYKPLQTVFTKADTFSVAFDLQLKDVAVFNYGQQIAIGLVNFSEATNASFSRPNANSPDLFELDYFPDTGYGDSIDASLADMTVSSASWQDFYFAYANQSLQTNVTYHIVLTHTAGSTTITGQIFTNGALYSGLTHVYAGPITDFRLDTLSVSSYADDGWGDDILAHGVVDNFTVAFSPPAASATTLMESFFSNPLQRGWNIFGDTNLFHWDSTNQNLAVTWDSAQSNSYFYKPLGTILTKADAFTVNFDVQVNDLQWTNTFQIAVGFLNFSNATNPGFSRALGYSPDLFEFNYFPDDGYGEPNLAASMTDQTTNITSYPDFYFAFGVQPMNLGVKYHVQLSHAAGAAAISGIVYTNGQVYTTMPKIYAGAIGDFRLDTLSISSYSGAGQDPNYYPGSILAHGTVDNFIANLPPPVRNVAGIFGNGQRQVNFATYTNWHYTLQRTTDFQTWQDASTPVAGNGAVLFLQDTNPPADKAFYRMRTEQP